MSDKEDTTIVCYFCGKELTKEEKDNYKYVNICDDCDGGYKEM